MRPFLLSVAALACAAKAPTKLTVVTTTSDLASIVREVGRDRVAVSSIVTGARDPHRIEAKPSFMSRAAGADLWVAIGLELEIGYERAILDGSRNRRIAIGAPGHVYASSWIKPLDVPGGPVSRSHGDVHPMGNPHIWLDPANGRAIALRLAEKMGALDRPNASFYEANAEAFAAKIDVAMFGSALVQKFGAATLWSWDSAGTLGRNLTERGAAHLLGGWEGKMLRHRGKPIVTYHRSWNYFARRFDLRIVDELEPKPGLDPTPGHIAEVIRAIQASGAKAILQEPFYSRRNGEFVASRTGAQLVVAPLSVGHDPAARDYLSLFDTIVDRLSVALGR